MTATLPARRYVEHVMGMPISLALRGRHTDDTPAVTAWTAALAELRQADRVFSTYRADSAISRLGRGEITLADCPPEVAEVLALGEAAERDSGGAFAVRRGGVLDPSGVVKGWAAERAATHLAALPGTDFCLSAGGDSPAAPSTPPGRPGASASRTRTTRPGWSRSSPCTPGPSPPPAPPGAAPTSSTRAPVARPPASRRSPSSVRR